MSRETPLLTRRGVIALLSAAGTGGLAGCSAVPDGVGENIDDVGDTVDNLSDGSESGGDSGDGSGDDGGSGDGSESGGDSGDGSGDDGGSGDGGGDLTCTDITNGYDQQDVGARPIIFDFEYPAIFGDFEYLQGPNSAYYEDEQSTRAGSIQIEIIQVTTPDESLDDIPEQTSDGATTTFNGEEVTFAGQSSGADLSWVGNLPYQIDGSREVFTTGLYFTVVGEESNECGDALRDAAEQFVDSLSVNPETTIEAET